MEFANFAVQPTLLCSPHHCGILSPLTADMSSAALVDFGTPNGSCQTFSSAERLHSGPISIGPPGYYGAGVTTLF